MRRDSRWSQQVALSSDWNPHESDPAGSFVQLLGRIGIPRIQPISAEVSLRGTKSPVEPQTGTFGVLESAGWCQSHPQAPDGSSPLCVFGDHGQDLGDFQVWLRS